MTKHRLWIDFETTGLDVHDDDAVEVYAVVTDQFNRPVAGEVESLIQPSPEALYRAITNQFVYPMHTANGLLDDIAHGLADDSLPDLHDVEEQIVTMLEEAGCTKGKVKLSGSGVGHFDLPFIQARMPRLAEWLTYYVHDVGNLRRGFEDETGRLLVRVNNDKTHRARQDVECHIAEDAAFKALFARSVKESA